MTHISLTVTSSFFLFVVVLFLYHGGTRGVIVRVCLHSPVDSGNNFIRYHQLHTDTESSYNTSSSTYTELVSQTVKRGEHLCTNSFIQENTLFDTFLINLKSNVLMLGLVHERDSIYCNK